MKLKKSTPSDGYMGTTTVGERGQIVIPKELRDEVGLDPGSRVVLMRHGKHGPIVMFPLDQMNEFMAQMTSRIAKLATLNK
ncbi:MAG: AbrB/MazE/SpoVT family DNA-binding domain-containing protein [Patescibacteria group bacterium]